jgi:hypothetical protein
MQPPPDENFGELIQKLNRSFRWDPIARVSSYAMETDQAFIMRGHLMRRMWWSVGWRAAAWMGGVLWISRVDNDSWWWLVGLLPLLVLASGGTLVALSRAQAYRSAWSAGRNDLRALVGEARRSSGDVQVVLDRSQLEDGRSFL